MSARGSVPSQILERSLLRKRTGDPSRVKCMEMPGLVTLFRIENHSFPCLLGSYLGPGQNLSP